MGNHDAGKAMGLAAVAWWEARGDQPEPTKEEAIYALDTICKPWVSCDAEFEAEDPNKLGYVHPVYDYYTDPTNGAPLGRLINIAFGATPEQIADYDSASDNAGDDWYDNVYTPFKKRYDFY